ncbi:glucan endo-1,3-beta-glucosidase 13-like isoform X1 [Bidens hawaiensis]|uniref:glucan endo-1,3-beta-glucosidase 13-like isoform X1 n=2 Tax=Bidens hawaiensis TaxID=980011 RepID=UPI00404A6CD4
MSFTLQTLLALSYLYVVVVGAIRVEEKADGALLSPPEGNMTFLDSQNWCVASPSASQDDLQNALDWACGLGLTDCNQIRPGGPCYQPDTLYSHASFAFNSYYQQNGNSDVACNFGGAAMLTKNDPSYGKCKYAASEPKKSGVESIWKLYWWESCCIVLLLYIVS